jgi:disulfide bond formation protein DsbB
MQKLLKFQSRVSQKLSFLIIAGVSGLSVCISFFMELIFGQIPCLLCLVQRGLHGLLFALAVIGAFSYIKTLSLKCCQGLLIASCLVAGYHSLVQLKLVKDRCKNHSQVEDFASYKDLLLESGKRRPSCSEDIWKIGPIPISMVNGLLSLLLLSLARGRREGDVAAGLI